MLKLEGWKASDWIDIVADVGAKYVVFTSKHHDGFCNFTTKHSAKWNSVETGNNRKFIYVTSRTQARCCIGIEKGL